MTPAGAIRLHESILSATIYDIAKEADVSIATVSRVFNNSPRVAPPTRERVLSVARGLNYEPHVSAQSLARRNSHLITAVIPVVANYFYMEIIRGMQEALLESDYDLILYAAPKPETMGSQLERAAKRGRSEGLIVASMPLSERRARRLKSLKRPVVLVDSLHPEFDSISVDNRQGGYMATRHLIDIGRQRIAHITINPEAPPAAERRRGYEDALRAAGREVDRNLIVAGEEKPFGFVEDAGYEAMGMLLSRKPMPDAVFVASDIQALGALRALREAGVRTPEDVALVGFDDIQVSAYVGLTTLRQPTYEMGALAMERLMRRIDEPGVPVASTVFAPKLISRASTQDVTEGV